ncbi:MAG: tellurite resistance/C4-dicarboxylate transporter family protein [Bacteroidales bacterium]|nr:tellurite resistance/C4-dicarboxylate transporter family protein [Bacteroidales bacterium]
MPSSRARTELTNLPANIFAIVMATGIVSLAAGGSGLPTIGNSLLRLNTVLYPLLLIVFGTRLVLAWSAVAADFSNHAKAPGFFTMVAGPCVLGSQFLILDDWPVTATVLLGIGFAHWVGLSYLMLPNLMTAEVKPPPERGLSGAWLLVVVGTQAISVLASVLLMRMDSAPDWGVFASLAFWLAGSMIYLWIISQIFNRILFLPLAPNDLTPPYWINMGAMAIATLAGARLVGLSNTSLFLMEIRPFLIGMTLLFWATATWWIPILFVLGIWRHLTRRIPLTYDHSYWAAVFPLGMYTVCTRALIDSMHLPFLAPIADVFVWIALLAWAATFTGLMKWLLAILLPVSVPPLVPPLVPPSDTHPTA